MNLETFCDKFGMLADTPNGVQKLRELILQFAVQGKLVPQDSYDVPASILLAMIKNEKEQLVKEKKIKKSIPIASVESNETPYDLPDNWIWVNLDQISNMVHYGYTASANHNLKEIRLLRITDIQKNKVNWDTVPGCEINGNNLDNYKLNYGDLLIARTGGTIGKSYLVDNLPICAIFASYLIRIIPSSSIQPKYFKLFLDSPLYWNQLYAKSMGTGQPNVNGTSLRSLIVPLPPLEEQKRIVTKVDQLMALCDQLEARQQKKHEKRIRLNNAALDKLLTAPTPEELSLHWQRICDNFDLLYDAPETVGQLRQAILQLAVQGKLVAQNPGDEPAAVLLEKIIVDREQLIKNKKISKSNSFPPINRDKVPYDLPNGWEWTRFGDTAKMVEYGTSQKSTPDDPGIPVLRMNNIQEGKLIYENLKYIPKSIKDLPRLYLKHNDILFNRTNSYELVGKTAIYKGESETFSFASYLIRASLFIDYLVPDYINIVLNSDFFRITQIEPEITQQCGQANFNGTKLKNSLIPLPPRNEQKRIVAKVDQLMALCDELEAGLVQAQTDGGRLMEAVVHHVLSA